MTVEPADSSSKPVRRCGDGRQDGHELACRVLLALGSAPLPAGDPLLGALVVARQRSIPDPAPVTPRTTGAAAATRGLEAVRGPHFHWTQVGFKALRDLYRATGRPAEAAAWADRLSD